MPKEIKQWSEVSTKKTLLYIYGENCGACNTAKPLVAEFEEKHPEIEVLQTKMAGRNLNTNPEDKPFFDIATERGMTPSFAYLEEGEIVTSMSGLQMPLEAFVLVKGRIANKDHECEHQKENTRLKRELDLAYDMIAFLKGQPEKKN